MFKNINIQILDSTSVPYLIKVAGTLFKSHSIKGQITLTGFYFVLLKGSKSGVIIIRAQVLNRSNMVLHWDICTGPVSFLSKAVTCLVTPPFKCPFNFFVSICACECKCMWVNTGVSVCRGVHKCTCLYISIHDCIQVHSTVYGCT